MLFSPPRRCRQLRLGRRGQRHDDLAAARPERRLAAMTTRHLTDDGKTEPGAGRGAVELAEAGEDRLLLSPRDARSLIADLDHQAAGLGAQRQADDAASVPQRIFEQVAQEIAEIVGMPPT